MGRRIAMPLRVLLPCLAVALVASGAAAIGAACVSAGGGYVTRQADDGLRACASSILSHGLVAVPGSGPAPGQALPGTCGMELLSGSGQALIPAVPGPAIPASGSWLAAHLVGPVTRPGAGSGGRWRVLIKAVRYQAQRMLFVYGTDDVKYVISGPAGHGSSGMLVVMTGLAGTGPFVAGYVAAAGTVLVLLFAAAFAVTRAILRPLHAAAGSHGRYGATLARVRERLQASRAAEAAARRSAADLAEQLGETCLQLRRPASILRGFTEYCGQQGHPPPASLDRMVQRVTGEITRMETLIEGLPRGARCPDFPDDRRRCALCGPRAAQSAHWRGPE